MPRDEIQNTNSLVEKYGRHRDQPKLGGSSNRERDETKSEAGAPRRTVRTIRGWTDGKADKNDIYRKKKNESRAMRDGEEGRKDERASKGGE